MMRVLKWACATFFTNQHDFNDIHLWWRFKLQQSLQSCWKLFFFSLLFWFFFFVYFRNEIHFHANCLFGCWWIEMMMLVVDQAQPTISVSHFFFSQCTKLNCHISKSKIIFKTPSILAALQKKKRILIFFQQIWRRR